MGRLIRTVQRTLVSVSSSFYSSYCVSSKSQSHVVQVHPHCPCNSLLQSQSPNALSPSFLFQSRPSSTGNFTKSPFQANILRILHNEIDFQSEYAPPHQPGTKFNSFEVQDRPGEQWITMNGRYNDNEDIKIDATMFDGYVSVPKPGDDSTGENVRLHTTVLVDISKDDGTDALEFVCSAWPDCLEIQKVYLLSRDKMICGRPYMGPDFRNLNNELKKKFREFLEARGVNDELSVFLHEYMMNKDRIELIQWFGKIKSFLEK